VNGIPGDAGSKGDRGPQGLRGEVGQKGESGETGAQVSWNVTVIEYMALFCLHFDFV